MIEQAITQEIQAAKARSASEARSAPGGLPPLGNTGGKSPERVPVAARLVLENGEVKEVPARRGHGGSASFVDWLNFTVHEDTFYKRVQRADVPLVTWLDGEPEINARASAIADEHLGILCQMSMDIELIFGFGITSKRPNGANFYRDSYVLGDGFGLLCIGGQRSTVLVSLSGAGCAAARPGWEERLKSFLEAADSPRITRVDLAHDDYQGVHGVTLAAREYDEGLFNNGGRHPDCEMRGNWKRPTGKGRSFYVGNRQNGKFYRAYEKGKQLGDSTSEWVRHEVEMKSVDRVLPFDILTRPGEYLAAAYPALAWVEEHQERILTTQKTAQITYAKTMEWLRQQCGRALWACKEIEGSADALLSKIMRVGEMPPRLVVPSYLTAGLPVHRSLSGAIV